MATLYIVATPIGNLGDMSNRAVETLRELNYVFAEDTRVARRLLAAFGLTAKLSSIRAQSKEPALRKVVERLGGGDDVGYLCDAGTPTISDPGATLVNACVERGHNVVPIPGPSAPIAALSVSGFAADHFEFVGFLARTTTKKRKQLTEALSRSHSVVILESPHRIMATLEMLNTLAPDRRLCVCRELTKLHEQIVRGTAAEALSALKVVKGEFTLVVSARPKTEQPL